MNVKTYFTKIIFKKNQSLTIFTKRWSVIRWSSQKDRQAAKGKSICRVIRKAPYEEQKQVGCEIKILNEGLKRQLASNWAFHLDLILVFFIRCCTP